MKDNGQQPQPAHVAGERVRLFTTGEVARKMRCSVDSICRWCEAGAWDAFRLPGRGHWRIWVDSFGVPVPARESAAKLRS